MQPNIAGEWGHIRKKKEIVFLISVLPTADSALYQEEEGQSREEHRQDQLDVRTELKNQQVIETQCLIDLRSTSHEKFAGIASDIRKEFTEKGGHEAVIHNPDTEKFTTIYSAEHEYDTAYAALASIVNHGQMNALGSARWPAKRAGLTAEDALDVFQAYEHQRTDENVEPCLLYTSPSPRDQRGSRMPSSA